MTRKDFRLIADCIAECHNKKYDLDDIIGCFRYRLADGHDRFNPSKFKEYIYQRTAPKHIPEEQVKKWGTKKAGK